MTIEELRAMLRKPGCQSSNRELAKQLLYDYKTAGEAPDTKPERHQKKPLDPAVSGETESVPRVIVSFIGRRVRPLDPDNFAASVKDLLDGLRAFRLIQEDGFKDIRLVTEQERVRSFAEEETLIEITFPEEG